MKQKNFKKTGLGIVEVIVAVIFVGFAGLLVMEATTFFAKSKVTQEQDLAFLRLVQGIDLILSGKNSCEGNLSGRGLTASGIVDEINLPGIGLLLPGTTSVTAFANVGAANPAGTFLEKISINEMKLISQGFLHQTGADIRERWNFRVRAQRPGGSLFLGSQFYERNFEIVLRMSATDDSRTILECYVPQATAGVTTTLTPQMGCTQLGGDWIPGTPPRCDMRGMVCDMLGVEQETTGPNEGQCKEYQVRQVLRIGMLANGPCADGDDVVGWQNPLSFGAIKSFLQGVGPDSSPFCGRIDAGNQAPVPVFRGVIANPPLPAPQICGRCWAPSVVPCFNAPTTRRYRIFEGGVLVGQQCGFPAGLPRCTLNITWGNPGVPCAP